jgi:hypothetical protein
MSAHAVVLCLQDTTALDFNGQQIAERYANGRSLHKATRRARKLT